MADIYEKQLRELRICTPTLEEQKLISRYLDEKTEQIDSAIEKNQQKIALNLEYR